MLKQIAALLFVSFSLLLFTGCPNGGYRHEQGHFPYDPVNFDAVNSPYDDYNSTAPFIEQERYLYFSSNRNSSGGHFDIVGNNVRMFWDKDDGRLTVDGRPHSWKDLSYTDSLFARVNSSANELGPYSIAYQSYALNSYYYKDMMVFASDAQGNLDLHFAYFMGWGENPAPSDGTVHGPYPVTFLNTTADEAYLTFYGPGYYYYDYYSFDPSQINGLMFCSSRNGSFDLFSAAVPPGADLVEFLSGESGPVAEPVNILNSSSDDKCPYVNGGLLVFASDRPGGYGGFDLYYSQRNGESWSEPVNFGQRINTEFDEYRPIVFSSWEFQNDMMIFSSDRPGGKGGFDLYYVGISKMGYYYLD